MAANIYSRHWFETFLARIDPDHVAPEVAFVNRQLSAVAATRVLDLCCGPGRHALPLAALGYDVVGVDLDAAVLRAAASQRPSTFVRGDMRRIPLATTSVDAVLCLWQSFGHFDDAGNTAALTEMARVLRPNGRLLLDLYHREFYGLREGHRLIERDGAKVEEHRTMYGTRLRVHLRYESNGFEEEFDWRLYTPAEVDEIAAPLGLRLRLACSEFNETLPPSGEHARMQLVLELGR
jgi:SAM-dependent methyltransferase